MAAIVCDERCSMLCQSAPNPSVEIIEISCLNPRHWWRDWVPNRHGYSHAPLSHCSCSYCTSISEHIVGDHRVRVEFGKDVFSGSLTSASGSRRWRRLGQFLVGLDAVCGQPSCGGWLSWVISTLGYLIILVVLGL